MPLLFPFVRGTPKATSTALRTGSQCLIVSLTPRMSGHVDDGFHADHKTLGTDQSVGVVGSAHADADFNMQSAIFAGLSLSETMLSQQLPLHCPSGNCTREPFFSLSVCSECNNVTRQLTRQSCDNCSQLFYLVNQPSAITDIRKPGSIRSAERARDRKL